ncbi:MAG: hypothetical protein WDM78_13965 [Puia sp.]
MQEMIYLQDGTLPLESGLPQGYRGIILKGAVAAHIQTPTEMAIIQHFQRAEFAIHLGIYKFIRLVNCILQPPAFNTSTLLALKTGFSF